MRIAILAAGAGGMYCGSCLRDNLLAGALRRLGHDVTLIPLYTPLRTESRDQSIRQVFFGGVNVYLEHAAAWTRRLPAAARWLLDRRWLLHLAGSMGAATPPAKLGALTIDVLRGEDGHMLGELTRLTAFLHDLKPEVVSLPNLMFVGMARSIREATHAPIVCELTGEDFFLESMLPADQAACREIIRERAGDITAWVATSGYYADRMAEYIGVPRERVAVVYPAVPETFLATEEELAGRRQRLEKAGRRTVGYLARLAPEKGIEQLFDALCQLHGRGPEWTDVRLRYAGYLGRQDRLWERDLSRRMAASALGGDAVYLGEVDLEAKVRLLDSLQVFSVPAVHPEPKGVYVLEALARGVPVVLPRHGAFTELVGRTGGGVLVQPGDAGALAGGLAELLTDAGRGGELGRAGWQAVRKNFTDRHMAQGMLRVYESCGSHPSSGV